MYKEGGRGAKKKKCRRCGYDGKLNTEEICRSCEATKVNNGGRSPGDRPQESKEDDGENDNCGTCKAKVKENQHGLMCEVCDRWFHCGCEQVGAKEYVKIMELSDIVAWSCRRCRGQQKDMKVMIKKLKEENMILKVENEELQKRLLAIESKVESIEKGVNVEETLIEEISERVLEVVREEEDKRNRLNNLVLFGVHESDKEQGYDREQDDKERCNEIFDIGVGIGNVEIEQVIRLGKRNSSGYDRTQLPKPRPLLVKLRYATAKFDILKKAKNLRNAESERLKSIMIAPDMTKKEREKDKKFREELKIKKDSGETGWYIKRGQLLQRNF